MISRRSSRSRSACASTLAAFARASAAVVSSAAPLRAPVAHPSVAPRSVSRRSRVASARFTPVGCRVLAGPGGGSASRARTDRAADSRPEARPVHGLLQRPRRHLLGHAGISESSVERVGDLVLQCGARGHLAGLVHGTPDQVVHKLPALAGQLANARPVQSLPPRTSACLPGPRDWLTRQGRRASGCSRSRRSESACPGRLLPLRPRGRRRPRTRGQVAAPLDEPIRISGIQLGAGLAHQIDAGLRRRPTGTRVTCHGLHGAAPASRAGAHMPPVIRKVRLPNVNMRCPVAECPVRYVAVSWPRTTWPGRGDAA